MKKFSVFFLSLLFAIFATSCELVDEVDDLFDKDEYCDDDYRDDDCDHDDDRRIGADELPQTVQDYIRTNYPNATVRYAEIDPDYVAYYEVKLSNGLELYFDREGNFLGFDDDYSHNNSQNPSDSNVSQTFIEQALALFGGSVVYTDRYTENGINLTEILVENAEGARVEFYFNEATGVIYQVDAERGPFNYDMQLNDGWLTLSEAISAGCEAAQSADCEIVEWELINSTTRPYFDIDFQNGIEVKIDATNGNVISVERYS